MKRHPVIRTSAGTRLSDIGEQRLIELLCSGLPANAGVVVGPGDDCAVVRPCGPREPDWLIKSDPLIEGVHFERRDRPERIGRKALARVLSDMAAMGGMPLWVNINLTAPQSTAVDRLRGFYRGLTQLARRHGVAVTGGDLSAARQTSLHVFGIGCVPRGRAVTRRGARPGQAVCVTGRLGGSRHGRHLDFEPRLREGQWLQRGGWATAMIDISDGLAADLGRLARASRCGALIEAADIPLAAAARPGRRGTALERALRDGEDYELLFTVAPRRVAGMLAEWRKTFKTPCTLIGILRPPAAGLRLRRADGTVVRLEPRGFEHFRPRNTS